MVDSLFAALFPHSPTQLEGSMGIERLAELRDDFFSLAGYLLFSAFNRTFST
jgi:hypothetical protein